MARRRLLGVASPIAPCPPGAPTVSMGWCLREPVAHLTGGVFLVGYALALKASEVQIGLLAAFPLLANISQPFSTYVLERIGRRRPLALLGGSFARLIWLVLIALSLVLTSRRSLLYWSMWVIALSQVGTAVNNLAWMSWMADLVR